MASRRRSVVWVNQFAVTPADAGGTRHFDLAKVLDGLGWEVTVLASDFHLHKRRFTRRPVDSSRGPIDEIVSGVRFRWLWSRPYRNNDWHRLVNWLSFGWAVAREVTSSGNLGRPLVLIGSSPQPFAALGAWVLARRLRVPFILEVRDLWPESLEAVSGRRGMAYHLLGSLARFLYRQADRVIILARGNAAALRAAGVADQAIIYIPNGIDPSTFVQAARPERSAITLVYAGAHGPANGLEAVLAAAEILRADDRIRFLLVGDGPAKESLVTEARRLSLPNVEFRAPVGKNELGAVFAEADAGLMVLRDAPLFASGVSPNKLFDYLAAGLPVVSNVPGDVAEMLRLSGAGEQSAGPTAIALAEAIRRLAARAPEERREMGRRGRAWVLAEHDRRALARRVAEVLDEVVSG